RSDLKEAIRLGLKKINVGSILKRSYFEALRRACSSVGEDYNPYEVVGSGLQKDVLTAGRVALQKTVQELMSLFGSAGRA
ncbi:MAG TPA: class II fructose-bisphosphate aldolase, partial [Terriglobia bacterium]|nr:class II fructose-bisphosphate aldolase [Terriglobia bacterium]